jgi:hypothetical protein
MAVLNVTDVRNHLYWAGGGPRSAGSGSPSTAVLGRLFHRVYGALTGPDPQLNFVAPLELADASPGAWGKALLDHAFVTMVSSGLAEQEAALRTHGVEVTTFWTAVRELCGWLADIVAQSREIHPALALATLRSEMFAGAEVELETEFTDPAWPESILLQGRADAVLKRQADSQRCVIELKIGRTAPEADLLQGCLYHWMFSRRETGGASDGAALGILSFDPYPKELIFEAAQLEAARDALKTVLAELAFPAARPSPAPASASVIARLRGQLERGFAEFGAPLTFADETACGPTFLRFFATPQRGVAAKRLPALSENLWMRLGHTSKPPQISLQQGRVAIDVERPDRQAVTFAAWHRDLPPPGASGNTRFAVGVSVEGALHLADLAESQSPHLLVVGTTGSGKSEWLRAFLGWLMASNTPTTLRLALIDPKRLAFASLETSPYLWRPVVYDEGVIALLDAMIDEMQSRYERLQRAGSDDLTQYNDLQRASSEPVLPRIVCVCDEFAELLLQDKKVRQEIEARVARLGVKGRAAGMHLVFATQRAGREILKGTIDSNLPARVALSVPREIDSRLVLGEPGAEKLLGKGDLLYKDIGAPVRLQGLLVTREELAGLAATRVAPPKDTSES